MAKKKKEEAKPVHPNDRFFRGYLGVRKTARQLLRWQLNPELQDSLNWNTMRVRNTTFIDERLRLRESDLLIEFKSKEDDPVLVYVLWEHQSRVDPLMAWRIQAYRCEITQAWLLENPKAKQIPYIHAMVLYQGKGKWSAPLDLEGLISFGRGREGLQKISGQYEVLPVIELPEIGWPKDLALRLGLGLMRAVTLKKQCQWLVEHAADLDNLLNESGGEVSFQIVIEYIFITSDEKEVIEALEQTPKRLEKKVMTFAEALETKGLEKGLEKGREKERRNIVEAMRKKGLSVSEISDVTGLPEAEIKKIVSSLSSR